jgi:hypothetical protein
VAKIGFFQQTCFSSFSPICVPPLLLSRSRLFAAHSRLRKISNQPLPPFAAYAPASLAGSTHSLQKAFSCGEPTSFRNPSLRKYPFAFAICNNTLAVVNASSSRLSNFALLKHFSTLCNSLHYLTAKDPHVYEQRTGGREEEVNFFMDKRSFVFALVHI